MSKWFEILLNISENYETRIVVSSHNFNKLKYITNKQHSVTSLQLLHSYPCFLNKKENKEKKRKISIDLEQIVKGKKSKYRKIDKESRLEIEIKKRVSTRSN